MILVMSQSKENHAAALSLMSLGKDKIIAIDELKQGLEDSGDHLIILDIDADDKFVRYLDPSIFAETLLKNGLSSSVSSIVFFVSDINQHDNLCSFSRHFIGRLEKEWGHQVTAYVPTNLNYASVFIIPPSEENHNWRVMGIQERPMQPTLNLGVFEAIKDKQLLWEGVDILSWITTNDRAINTLPDGVKKAMFSL